jgi:hypothetical protein
MKTRTGFVSNSSSSSFIVGFEKKPKTIRELQTLMFGDMPDNTNVLCYDYAMDVKTIATTVFNDLKGKKTITKAKLREEIRCGYFDGRPSYDFNQEESDRMNEEYRRLFPAAYKLEREDIEDKDALAFLAKIDAQRRKEWKEYDEACNKATDEYMEKKVLPKFKGMKVFVLNYGDEDGQALMEHGDIFNNISYIRISHH